MVLKLKRMINKVKAYYGIDKVIIATLARTPINIIRKIRIAICFLLLDLLRDLFLIFRELP